MYSQNRYKCFFKQINFVLLGEGVRGFYKVYRQFTYLNLLLLLNLSVGNLFYDYVSALVGCTATMQQKVQC